MIPGEQRNVSWKGGFREGALDAVMLVLRGESSAQAVKRERRGKYSCEDNPGLQMF